MPGSNRKRLEINQNETHANVTSYLDTAAAIDIDQIKRTQGRILDVHSANIDQMIADPRLFQESMEIQHDLALGIITTTRANHEDGTVDLIRDARLQSEIGVGEDKAAERISYAIQTLNTLEATKKILEFHDHPDKNQQIEEIEALAKQRLQQIFNKDVSIKKNKDFDLALIEKLESFGVDSPDKKLNAAKNFAAMDNKQYHVSTITTQTDAKGNPRIVVESNNMLLGLTEKQKQQYADRANQDWYKKLSDFDRGLVDQYADKIIGGEVVIPTQLRKHLPGLRNAYLKSTYAEKEGKDGFDKVLETFHSGTVSFHGKGDKVKHTGHNVGQLESFLPDGKRITINPLNSPQAAPGIPNPFNDIDRAAPGLIKEAQEKREIDGRTGRTAVTPFNALRRAAYNDNTGFDLALYEIGSKLQGHDAIASFLKDGKKKKAAEKQLDTIEDLELKALLKDAIKAKDLIVNTHGIFDLQNRNLELASLMNIVSFKANQGEFKDIPGLDVDFIDSHCASGKDRNGILQTRNSHEALNSYFGLDAEEHKGIVASNLETQIKGAHTQTLASLNGGTPGSHGVKDDSKSACPRGSKYSTLIEDTSKGNKVKGNPNRAEQLGKVVVGIIASPFILVAAVLSVLYYVGSRIAGYSASDTKKQYEKDEAAKEVAQHKSQERVVSKEMERGVGKGVDPLHEPLLDPLAVSDSERTRSMSSGSLSTNSEPEFEPLLKAPRSRSLSEHEIVGPHTEKVVKGEKANQQGIEVGGVRGG